ncbi:GPI mannosyltransferase 2 [Fasciola gigantica]|uniref:GPI mannosyltransferase 2 n=1 Tax=Fasciola gigantica TaxID=46835 RepID=A0A504YL27_FASGI|nr:GPI mannosyltransferase 2 [Fasciola gigantica]
MSVQTSTEVKSLLRYCFLVRTLGFVLTVSLFLLPDHNADAFNPPQPVPQNRLDSLIREVLRGYRRWDSLYFSFIAQWNYLYEQSLAFFPLWPCLLGVISRICHRFVFAILQLDTVILLAGIILNLTFGLAICVLLFRLGLVVLGSVKVSYFAAVLFCLNPALVFFSSLYSESVFLFFTLLGLLSYEQGRLFRASFFFALSVACRSNGLLNLGYIGYALICSDACSKLIWNEHTILDTKRSFATLLKNTFRWWFLLAMTLLPYLCFVLISLLPLIVYQVYAYYLFCSDAFLPGNMDFLAIPRPPQSLVEFGRQAHLQFPRFIYSNYSLSVNQPPPSWCLSNLPFSYSHIQKSYWSVSLFGYYEFKQIPNFLLASPVVLLSLACAAAFYARAPKTYKTLGLTAETPRDRRLLPYVLHMLFLTVYGVTHINVQVLTRIIFSSCPVIYWYCAYLLSNCSTWQFTVTTQLRDRKKRDVTKSGVGWTNTCVHTIRSDFYRLISIFNPAYGSNRKQKVLLLYFVSYAVMGTVLHSKFLPWT